jgi:acetolactate synthase small subunit
VALHTVLSLVADDHLRVAEVMEDGLIIEATGEWKDINTLVSKLMPFGIRHIVRTGTVAVSKQPGVEVMRLVGTKAASSL